MNLSIFNAYDFYLNRILKKLRSTNLSDYNEIINTTGIKICIFDFCGKLKYYMKLFIKLTSDIYLIDNDYENDIYEILGRFDIVYFFDDIEFVSNNIFYKELCNKNKFIFVLFSGGKFVELKIFV